MNLRSLMQSGPAKAIELFTKLTETTDTAPKTRERLFGELKTELEKHLELEEKHLFPALRKHAETKELVATAARDTKDLRAMLSELEALPKTDAAFLPKVAELQKAFRQHARDEKRDLLPAVQKALSDEQVQGIVEKIEGSLAEAEQARASEAEERRAAARREREEREQAELQVQQEEQAEQERQAAARRAQKVARETVEATARAAEASLAAVAEGTRQVARAVTEETRQTAERALEAGAEAVERTTAAASAMPRTGFLFWDAMFGLSAPSPSRAVARSEARSPATVPPQAPRNEEVIPLAEEILVVGKRTVNTGTTRIRRYVVEVPVEQQVSLMRERVIVERRRPATDKLTGEALTELSVEIVETDEVPVVAKKLQLREEVVIRTERTEHLETVRDSVRQEEVEIEHANARQRARARA